MRYVQQNGILVPQTSRHRQRGFITCGPAFFGTSGAPVLWTPSNLTAPPFTWVSDLTSVTDDGTGHASSWADAGGAFNYHANSVASPLIIASGQNGRRTLKFNGTTHFLASSGLTEHALFQGVTSGWIMFIGAKNAIDGSGVTRQAFFASVGNSSNNTRLGLGMGQSGAANRPCGFARRLDSDASAGVVSATSATDTGFHMWLLLMDWSTGTGTLYEDGTQIAQNVTMTSTGSTTNTASTDPLCIGSADGVQFADINAGEIMAGRALPSSTEIQKLFGYAAWTGRWGLQSLLPSGYPYKVNPPYV